jgi:hypothetical protein
VDYPGDRPGSVCRDACTRDAIRYGEREDVQRDLFRAIDNSLDSEKLMEIFRRNALVDNQMGLDALHAIKEEMDKADARGFEESTVRAAKENSRVLGIQSADFD